MRKKIAVIILLIIIVLAGFNYYTNIKKINQLKTKISELNKEIESSREKQANLKVQLKDIDNKDFVERIARTKLGLVKPGEILVIPVEEKKENKK